jgi:ParB family chromosome partitioning protein
LLTQAISAGHARALAGLPSKSQEEGLRRVLRDELNVRQTEVLAQSLARGPGVPRRARARHQQDPETRELEARFRDALQARVTLQRRRKGGRLVVDFHSDEELDSLYRRIVEPRSD